ncbi:MAG: hypothetical protein UY18_C0009G0015 [Microgenomates group bacterium GW2011_GWF2_47_9]|nr:MAG: hypothetical protein UY18_C0009G0015 [Microgenomates group bacterium GW2011_GWF2_47_9]
MLSAIACILFSTLTLYIATYLLAVLKRDNSIVDSIWGLGFILASMVSLSYSDFGPRNLLVFLLISLWGARLSIHISARTKESQEDFRYKRWREEWGNYWVIRSFIEIYLFQWFTLQLVAIPIFLLNTSPSSALTVLDALGILIWFFGFIFETVGDHQLTKFRSNPKNKLKIITSGLWRYTRHPNYFGEATLWWGIALIAFAQSHNLLAFVGPLTINFLLIKVSGIPLLEEKLRGRVGWKEYASRTSPFFPRLPERK